MSKRTWQIAIVVVIGLLGPSSNAHAQDSVALIVGNASYQHAAPLKNPLNDARALVNKLEVLGFRVLHGTDLTRKEFQSHIELFGMLMEDAEVAVLFYAGHGLQVDGENYLVPVDFDPSEAPAQQLVRLNDVLQGVASDTRVTLVFLDACRDNPFGVDTQSTNGGKRALSADATRSIKTVADGLAEVEVGVGTLISFATQPGNVALDGEGEHSPFAAGLLEYIGEPGSEVSDMLKRVRAYVYESTGGEQIPWDHSSLVQRYYFKKKKQRAAPPP